MSIELSTCGQHMYFTYGKHGAFRIWQACGHPSMWTLIGNFYSKRIIMIVICNPYAKETIPATISMLQCDIQIDEDSDVMILDTIDEVTNDFVEYVCERFNGKLLNSRIILQRFILIFTENEEVVEELEIRFHVEVYDQPPPAETLLKFDAKPISNRYIAKLRENVDDHGMIEFNFDSMNNYTAHLILSLFEVCGYTQYYYELETGKTCWLPTIKLIDEIAAEFPSIAASYSLVIDNIEALIAKPQNVKNIGSTLIEVLNQVNPAFYTYAKSDM